jgi:hypothetical protein
MSNTAESATGRHSSQWRGHRVAAMVLRVVVFLFPLSVAGVVGVLVSHSIPGAGVAVTVIRVVITAAVSVLAFVLVERLARRFLPLAALLRLNLVFPDRAPSRFSVALRATSVRKLQQWVREARQSEDAAVLAEKVVTLASALNTHDRRTRGHCERTRALADLIVEELHLPPAEANEVRWGAFLHDIGKLVVPPEILNKPGKPTDREWEILKSHPEAGARLVEPLRTFLSSGVDAVGSHHENYDGTGYPAGLSGDQLPLAARIVSVADAFEVMTAVRAYKRPMPLQAARAELARRSGTQFDPHVVRAFLNVSLGRLHWTLGFAAWVAEVPFLTLVPRLAAQLSTTAGAGTALSPATLPSIAAASLGAMVVVAHLDTPAPGHHHPVAQASGPLPAAAPTLGSTTSPTTSPSPFVGVTEGVAPTSPLGSTPVTTATRTALGTVTTTLHSTTATVHSVVASVDTAPAAATSAAADVVGDVLGSSAPVAVVGDALGPSGPVDAVAGRVGAIVDATADDATSDDATRTVAIDALIGQVVTAADAPARADKTTTATTGVVPTALP